MSNSPQLPAYLIPVNDLTQLKVGDIVLRLGAEKVQQGAFGGLHENGGIILRDVINLLEPAYLAEAGVVNPGSDDCIYRHEHSFDASPNQALALEIIHEWTLFRSLPELQTEILDFVRRCFSPEHIVQIKRGGDMKAVFVPVQQKFKIGKFKEQIRPGELRERLFYEALLSLTDGKHMTYVAFIYQDPKKRGMFFTAGTKPHEETQKLLSREPIEFKPSHGGHIKVVSAPGETPPRYVVDAGSNFLGMGNNTHISTAEAVTENLKFLYPDLHFTPMAGRGAYGIQQSY